MALGLLNHHDALETMQDDAVWISKGNESGSMWLTGPKKDVGCVTESFYSTTFDRKSPGKTRKTVYTQRFVLKIPNFKRHSSV